MAFSAKGERLSAWHQGRPSREHVEHAHSSCSSREGDSSDLTMMVKLMGSDPSTAAALRVRVVEVGPKGEEGLRTAGRGRAKGPGRSAHEARGRGDASGGLTFELVRKDGLERLELVCLLASMVCGPR